MHIEIVPFDKDVECIEKKKTTLQKLTKLLEEVETNYGHGLQLIVFQGVYIIIKVPRGVGMICGNGLIYLTNISIIGKSPLVYYWDPGGLKRDGWLQASHNTNVVQEMKISDSLIGLLGEGKSREWIVCKWVQRFSTTHSVFIFNWGSLIVVQRKDFKYVEPDKTCAAQKWNNHHHPQRYTCGVNFIWFLHSDKYPKLLKTSWMEEIFGKFKYLFKRVSLTESGAFVLLRSDKDYSITYFGFYKALVHIYCIGHHCRLNDEEQKNIVQELASQSTPHSGYKLIHILSITRSDILANWKITMAYFAFLGLLFNSHISSILNQDMSTFMYIVDFLESSLKGLNTSTSLRCASVVDNVIVFYFSNITMEEVLNLPATFNLACHIAECPNLFPEILKTWFENHSWQMATLHQLRSGWFIVEQIGHFQWEPGGNHESPVTYLALSLGGRLLSLLFYHLEDKVNFKGGSIDENLGLTNPGQTNRFGRSYSRRGKRGNVLSSEWNIVTNCQHGRFGERRILFMHDA